MGADDVLKAVELARTALIVAMKISLPLLLIGMAVGITISILQAATQVQEQTLTFVPKIMAVVASLFILAPWFMTVLMEYAGSLLRDMSFLFWVR